MTKVISLILVLAICLSLCACGNSNACSCDCVQCAQCEKKTHSHEAAEKETEENKIVFSEPVLLVENAEVRVELVSFNQKESIINGVSATRKYIALKIHNKAAYEIMFDLENLAVNDEQVNRVYQQPTTQYPRILSGDTTIYYIEIRPVFDEALDSMEDLYHLKGRVQAGELAMIQGFYVFRNASELHFSVEDAMGNSADDNS